MRHFAQIITAVVLISSCADYQFTVNDKVVYTPAPLFTEYDIPDAALRECVKQHVRDSSVTDVTQLIELNCSHAGIESLAGLETFSALQHLKLSSNAIGDIAPLATMSELRTVQLDGNQLRSVMPLRGLEELSSLSLQGNPALVCAQLTHFAEIPNFSLESPRHCTR
jgi:hypothetical protein